MGSKTGIIDKNTQVKEWDGQTQIGIQFEGHENWVNIVGEEEFLKELLNCMIWKGNTISYDLENGVISNISLVTEVPKPKGRPKNTQQPQSGETGKWQDDMVNFETLLKAAHDKNESFSIATKMLDINLEKKYALFKATVTVGNGQVIEEGKGLQVFEGHGDTTADNIEGSFIKPHFIRMAETRAIVRALRWYTNNAGCSEEEKGGK